MTANVDEPLTSEVLAMAETIIVSPNDRAETFTAAEIDLLVDYVQAGGGLFLVYDPRYATQSLGNLASRLEFAMRAEIQDTRPAASRSVVDLLHGQFLRPSGEPGHCNTRVGSGTAPCASFPMRPRSS